MSHETDLINLSPERDEIEAIRKLIHKFIDCAGKTSPHVLINSLCLLLAEALVNVLPGHYVNKAIDEIASSLKRHCHDHNKEVRH